MVSPEAFVAPAELVEASVLRSGAGDVRAKDPTEAHAKRDGALLAIASPEPDMMISRSAAPARITRGMNPLAHQAAPRRATP